MRSNTIVWQVFSAMFFVGLVLAAAALLAVVMVTWPPTLGVDLNGGVQLIYEVDRAGLAEECEREVQPDSISWHAVIHAIRQRIDPARVKDVVVRRTGDWQVEVVVPESSPAELTRVQRLISTTGFLEFRVVANQRDHAYLIDVAQSQGKDPERRKSRFVHDDDRQRIGFWARVDREPEGPNPRPFRVNPMGHVFRNAETGELIELPQTLSLDDSRVVERYLQEAGISEIELLVATDDRYDVSGAHLRMVSRALDETGQPCLNFAMGGDGTARMGGLTGSAIPTGQPPFYRSLGILLDGELLSAPRVMSTISDRGRLTGRFTQEEVDFLVGILQAGSLPVALQKTPVSQATVNPSQAARRLTTIAAWATLAGLAIIWLALLLRYRWIGLGAVLTSLLHGLIVLVTIELLRVPVTQLLTIASSVMLLVIAAGTALVCESVRRRFFAGKSVWRGLLRGVVPLGVLLVFLTILGVVAYVLGDFAVRNAAVAVAAGSVVGIATCCVVLPLLIALLAAARRNRDGDDAVIEAHVVA